MGNKAFRFEIAFWTMVASMIAWIGDMLDTEEWKMSPSRAYAMLADIVTLLRNQGYPGLDEPAFDFLIERLVKRSEELRGTEVDYALSMEMSVWRDRLAPEPGTSRSVMQLFDWFLPCLRYLESAGVQMTSARSTAAENVTQGEAVKWLLLGVDWLSKDRHFQERNAWGWYVPFPWADFVRDEVYEWSKTFPTVVEPVPPGTNTAFSAAGQ